MQIHTKEHYEMIEGFERKFSGRHDKEPKDMWAKGVIYQSGEMNNLFLAYRMGYAAGRAEYLNQ